MRLILLIVILLVLAAVQNEIGRDPCQKTIDQASHLPSGDHLRIDELTVQLEYQINYLRGIQPLLNVASQGHLIDTNLIYRQILQFVLQTQLGWLVLDAKVDRNDYSAGRQSREGLDTTLRLHVHAAIIVNVQRIRAGVLNHKICTVSSWLPSLRVSCVRNTHFKIAFDYCDI